MFLLQEPACRAVLKRWQGMNGGQVALSSNAGIQYLPASQVYLLATHVRLALRGQACNPTLLAGTIYAGLELWFREDIARILASTHKAMVASTSMCASAPPDPETAIYQQGFVDALRALGVAFGVVPPGSWDQDGELKWRY